MNEFNQIYEQSRTNDWSGLYYVTLGFSAVLLLGLSFIPNALMRRFLKVVSIISCSWLAMHFAACETDEKWRIRIEWAEANPDKVTEGDRFAMADRRAINAPFGPMLAGIGAFLALVLASFLLFVVRPSFWISGPSAANLETKREKHGEQSAASRSFTTP
jgi:hypothetical protein